jgi:hypothetical protein
LRWNSPDRLIRVRMLCNRKAPDPPVTGYTQNEQGRGCYPELAGRFLGLAQGGTAVLYLPDRSPGPV